MMMPCWHGTIKHLPAGYTTRRCNTVNRITWVWVYVDYDLCTIFRKLQ